MLLALSTAAFADEPQDRLLLKPGTRISSTQGVLSGIVDRQYHLITNSDSLAQLVAQNKVGVGLQELHVNFKEVIVVAIFQGPVKRMVEIEVEDFIDIGDAFVLRYQLADLKLDKCQAKELKEELGTTSWPYRMEIISKTTKPIILVEGVSENGDTEWIRRATLDAKTPVVMGTQQEVKPTP